LTRSAYPPARAAANGMHSLSGILDAIETYRRDDRNANRLFRFKKLFE